MNAESANLVESSKRVAIMMGVLEKRFNAVMPFQENVSTALGNTLTSVRDDLGRTVRDSQQQIQKQARTAVNEALTESLGTFKNALLAERNHHEKALAQIASRFKQSADSLHQERIHAARLTRMLTWKALTMLIAVTMLLLAGGSFLLWQTQQRIQSAQVSAEVQEALQRVQISSCGGQPCLRLDSQAPRWGKDGEFVLLKKPSP